MERYIIITLIKKSCKINDRQNRYQSKDYYQGQKESFYNDEMVSPSRNDNSPKVYALSNKIL